MERQLLLEDSVESLNADYSHWSKQFSETKEFLKDGYSFLIGRKEKTKKIVIYALQMYQSCLGKIFLLEISALASFDSVDDAQANWNAVVDYYIIKGRNENAVEL